ncbi:helix-turn-helix domain-containing protein [Agromyces allii]|uniref:HTH cro/C1-type domain-containing protein n=1 Tax=Agromyces allii TaxID=393607 RepID=A0ABN2PXS1_9MICO|nr:helix-turn-helix domain-containing protein [Agromyces allii]
MSAHIRDTRKRLGMTIYDLADKLGVTAGAISQMERSERDETIQLSTLKRALKAMGADLSTEAQDAPMSAKHLLTARTAAASMSKELAENDEDTALRIAIQSLDHFRHARTRAEILDFLREPPTTGDPRWDTLLATAIAWDAKRRKIRPPAWTRKPALSEEWLPATPGRPTERYLDMIRQAAEPEFREKGILMRERDLLVA